MWNLPSFFNNCIKKRTCDRQLIRHKSQSKTRQSVQPGAFKSCSKRASCLLKSHQVAFGDRTAHFLSQISEMMG